MQSALQNASLGIISWFPLLVVHQQMWKEMWLVCCQTNAQLTMWHHLPLSLSPRKLLCLSSSVHCQISVLRLAICYSWLFQENECLCVRDWFAIQVNKNSCRRKVCAQHCLVQIWSVWSQHSTGTAVCLSFNKHIVLLASVHLKIICKATVTRKNKNFVPPFVRFFREILFQWTPSLKGNHLFINAQIFFKCRQQGLIEG